jgi:hypothetical protein
MLDQPTQGKPTMMDYLTIGCSPAAEECAQVGREDYHWRSAAECRALVNQLRRVHGEEPPGARLGVKSFPHDFGSYREVVCHFDPENEAAVNYAYACETLPEEWDAQARKELAEAERNHLQRVPQSG